MAWSQLDIGLLVCRFPTTHFGYGVRIPFRVYRMWSVNSWLGQLAGEEGGLSCRPVDLEWWSGAPRLLWDFVLIYEFFRNNVRYFHMILGSCPDFKGTTRFLSFPFSPTSLGKMKAPNSPLFIFPFTMPAPRITTQQAPRSTLHGPLPSAPTTYI